MMYAKNNLPPLIHETGYEYAGFKKRLVASIIDALILLPITFIPYSIDFISKFMFFTVIGILIPLLVYLYTIGFEGYRGQTVGKIITNIKITSTDGKNIGFKKAICRNGVNIIISLLYLLLLHYSLNGISEIDFAYIKQSNLIGSIYRKNILIHLTKYLSYLWILSEFYVLNFNQKKRALHDYIAGTIVLDLAKNKKELASLERI